jgi:hypothetical protein
VHRKIYSYLSLVLVIVTKQSPANAGSNAKNDILEWHNRWSPISISERRNHQWPHQASKKQVGPQSWLWQTKIDALTKQCVLVHCSCKSTSSGSTTIMDILVDLLTQMLQTPLPVMLNTVWPGGTNSWSAMPSAHTVKYHHQHALYVQSWFSWFFQMRREWAFQLKWWFLGHNSKPRFNLKMELWSLLMYQAVPDIQMHVILLVVHEQSRNKPNGDPPQTEVPPYNLPACSTFHTRYLTCQWTSEMVLC